LCQLGSGEGKGICDGTFIIPTHPPPRKGRERNEEGDGTFIIPTHPPPGKGREGKISLQ